MNRVSIIFLLCISLLPACSLFGEEEDTFELLLPDQKEPDIPEEYKLVTPQTSSDDADNKNFFTTRKLSKGQDLTEPRNTKIADSSPLEGTSNKLDVENILGISKTQPTAKIEKVIEEPIKPTGKVDSILFSGQPTVEEVTDTISSIPTSLVNAAPKLDLEEMAKYETTNRVPAKVVKQAPVQVKRPQPTQQVEQDAQELFDSMFE